MNLDRDDEKLEAYLRQFRAQAPRPLPGKMKFVIHRRPAVVFAAVAALLIGAFGLTVWQRKGNIPAAPRPSAQEMAPALEEVSFVRLSRVAQEGPEKLDSYLNGLSKTLLPDIRKQPGCLETTGEGMN